MMKDKKGDPDTAAPGSNGGGADSSPIERLRPIYGETGSTAYAVYEMAHGEEGADVEPWEELDDREKRIWDRIGKVLPASLLEPLEQSVKLQSHYATLLNMHDGGTRMVFAHCGEWLARLRQLERTEDTASPPATTSTPELAEGIQVKP
jgi:hypothetical protein